MDEHDKSPETIKNPASPEQQITSDSKQKSPEPTSEDTKSQPKDGTAETLAPTDPQTIVPVKTNDTSIAEDMDEDDDQIQTAIPTDMMNTPGDQCAICIVTLEVDDDFRVLSCWHAFHAICLYPWLTARRACCPLCKADYYVPKPRPEGEAAAEEDRRSGRRAQGQRMDMPHHPPYAYIGQGPRRPRLLFPFIGGDRRVSNRYGLPNRQRRPRANDGPVQVNLDSEAPPNNRAQRRLPRFNFTAPTIRMPNFLRRNRQQPNETSAEIGTSETTQTTPGQLEAGQR